MTSLVSPQLADQLSRIVGAPNLLLDEPLSKHTTFKIGGPADALVLPTSVEQVQQVIEARKEAQVPLRFMGLGSNILVSDVGVRGVIVKFAENFASVLVEGTRIVAQAGASNEQVAKAAQAHGLAGYEFASGIPGSIGGAAIMNAGAYDGEFSKVAVGLSCLSPEGKLVQVTAEQAQWSYRHSMMMDKGYVVLEATLELTHDDKDAIQARMDDLRERRESKQPLEMPSAGSTFKRPEGYFAGKLIQDAGLKGYTVGGAQISTKHSGFVVNTGKASAADVVQLIQDVHDRIFEKEGVHMEPEVRMWGFEESE
ncbi:MAG: UDP-N-acetylmuramate dehydrogenase [Coriobacteriia bacterium]|nr:UDP-N-acetylmuramate dehydrogenase [Coriobacteriia bacterium]